MSSLPASSRWFAAVLGLVLSVACLQRTAASEGVESLSGRWRFALDRGDVGINDRWFERTLERTVHLPGSLPAQGIGDPVTVETKWTGGIVDRSWFTAPEHERNRRPGHVRIPFWLQPESYYAGPAWYQTDVKISRSWAGRPVSLFLERPHWETRLWLDGRMVGTNQSLSTPHEYALGVLAPGLHTISLRVDNRMVIDIGRDSHSISDHTQGNWNGVVGAIELRAGGDVDLDDLQVYPDASTGNVQIRGRVSSLSGTPGRGHVRTAIFAEPRAGAPGRSAAVATDEVQVEWDSAGGSFEQLCRVPAPEPWDEFRPNLYLAEITFSPDAGSRQSRRVVFGFRDWSTKGTQFVINGRPTFLRGTLECCIFPKTGHPPLDVEAWRRIIRVAKAHGLNNLRFHSWCPPEAAFQAGDELGMYFHVECSSWANASTTLGDGKPVDQWIYDEADRILRWYGNHPSFVMMLYGNEPGGPKHSQYLARWVDHYKALDRRRLFSSGAGWPQLPENQFHVTPDPRIQAWGAGLKSRINALPPETRTDYREYIAQRTVPVVSHEIGQWCVYPNFREIPKYTGYLKPKNFEIFQDTLAEHHMAALAGPFLFASGKLQTLCYKEDIESALRTPGMGGFQLLDLHDFPGQGTALVGVLDPFWESKGYVTPGEYRRFAGPTVPLARLPKRVFTSDEVPAIQFEVAHFGPDPLKQVWPVYKFVDDHGRIYQNGHGAQQDLALGNGQVLASLTANLETMPAPARYKLVFGIARDPDGRNLLAENDWDLWVYPARLIPERPEELGVTVVRELNATTLSRLETGGRVLWLIPPAQVAGDRKLGKVELGFSSIFWNTAWTGRQAPHTLGILCDPKHPLFAEFPTDSHSNWQWWYLVHRAGALILDNLPPKLRPTVQVIDDWVTARKLGLVIEAKVGRGRLLVCSIDLESESGDDPVTRQFRHSLLRYMAGERFHPKLEVSAEALQALVRAP